ncbi:MAG: RNA 2',3'-cyclic phosphodiesterase [Actinomycetota bacterium]|nr:RNA 2',3'-cyclic phosphodiesterase [Actinomycetota bacterium]
MSSASTVERRERLRLFLALPLPTAARDRLVEWQATELRGADARIVAPANLHVTLAFLGHRPLEEIDAIVGAMRAAAAACERPMLEPLRYRETRSVGMVVLADEDGHATRLAKHLFDALEALGVYEQERRAWLPHVTVLRFRRPPRLDPVVPDLGRFSPSEVALYHSVLRPTGAQYEIRESVALGG